MKILLVDDNQTILKALSYTLKNNSYDVTACDTCTSALKKSNEEYDVIIIDINLTDGNGFELYEDIKKYNNAPVIFLTALDDEDNIVKGLELGAEDYITKPFSTKELLARINRLTRKKTVKSNVLAIENVLIDFDKKTVSRNGENIELTALEYKILAMLARNVNAVISRESMIERIWDISGNYVNDNTLTVYIKRIREKIGIDCIKTVKGIGYRLEKK